MLKAVLAAHEENINRLAREILSSLPRVARELPDLLPDLAYSVISPYLGREATERAITHSANMP